MEPLLTTHSPDLDEQVPKHRRSARNVRIEVGDTKEAGTTAVIMVRITYQRGGGRTYYWLTHIDDIHQFYPKEMGQEVIDAVLVVWAERMLRPPGPFYHPYTNTRLTREADGWTVHTETGAMTRL